MNQEIDKNLKYVISKFPEIGRSSQEVAKFQVDNFGKLTYKMLLVDSETEQVLVEAQREGGLFCRVPFSDDADGVAITGQKREFVPTTDEDHFIDAVQDNLKEGIVDEE